MAPSRALLRCIASAQRRPAPHLLPLTIRMRTQSCCTLSSRSSPLVGLHTATPRHIPIRRSYSQSQHPPPPEPPDYLSEGELHIFNKIKAELAPVRLEVQDVSGGCGSMYALEIESPKFRGLTVIKQHKLVNSVLAEEIKSWHGVQLRTKAS
ncbi:bola protein [Dendryphion nanum]|uniref:Bola protein n=1 Tax=Dendryphion nanum TaxID=256645 RepID=A0A9P9IFV9_9PLEO|nr:bola protein [Dendryphion nanum]